MWRSDRQPHSFSQAATEFQTDSHMTVKLFLCVRLLVSDNSKGTSTWSFPLLFSYRWGYFLKLQYSIRPTQLQRYKNQPGVFLHTDGRFCAKQTNNNHHWQTKQQQRHIEAICVLKWQAGSNKPDYYLATREQRHSTIQSPSTLTQLTRI